MGSFQHSEPHDRDHEILDNQHKIIHLLREIKGLLMGLQDELNALTVQVQNNTDVEGSAITLIQGIAAKLNELSADPAAVKALAAKLKSSADALAAAVVANTPAEEPPPQA